MWNENQHVERQLQWKLPMNGNHNENYNGMENVNHQINEYYRGNGNYQLPNEECQLTK